MLGKARSTYTRDVDWKKDFVGIYCRWLSCRRSENKPEENEAWKRDREKSQVEHIKNLRYCFLRPFVSCPCTSCTIHSTNLCSLVCRQVFLLFWWKFIHRNKRLFSLFGEGLRFFLSSPWWICTRIPLHCSACAISQQIKCYEQHRNIYDSLINVVKRTWKCIKSHQRSEASQFASRRFLRRLNLMRLSFLFRQISDSELCSRHWKRFLCIDVKRPMWLSQLSLNSSCQVPFKNRAEATWRSVQIMQQFDAQLLSN